MKYSRITLCILVLAMLLAATIHTFATSQRFFNSGNLSILMDSMPAEKSTSANAWTVFGKDGSVRFSDETIRLLTDSAYRAVKYPEEYNAFQVADLLDEGDVSFALWTIINLYQEQPEHVRVLAFKLADHGIQGAHYLNAFYTYAFTDPDVMDYTDAHKPYLGDPQRLEEKLLHCRTLAAYTDKVIETQTGGK